MMVFMAIDCQEHTSTIANQAVPVPDKRLVLRGSDSRRLSQRGQNIGKKIAENVAYHQSAQYIGYKINSPARFFPLFCCSAPGKNQAQDIYQDCETSAKLLKGKQVGFFSSHGHPEKDR